MAAATRARTVVQTTKRTARRRPWLGAGSGGAIGRPGLGIAHGSNLPCRLAVSRSICQARCARRRLPPASDVPSGGNYSRPAGPPVPLWTQMRRVLANPARAPGRPFPLAGALSRRRRRASRRDARGRPGRGHRLRESGAARLSCRCSPPGPSPSSSPSSRSATPCSKSAWWRPCSACCSPGSPTRRRSAPAPAPAAPFLLAAAALPRLAGGDDDLGAGLRPSPSASSGSTGSRSASSRR